MSKPFEHVTKQLLNAMYHAQSQALRRGRNVVDTDHLLVGIVGTGKSNAGRILRDDFEIDLRFIQKKLDASYSREPSRPWFLRMLSLFQMTYATDSANALELAFYEARKLSLTTVGTEHLLLSILNMPGCRARKLLASCDLSADQIKDAVVTRVSAPDYSPEL